MKKPLHLISPPPRAKDPFTNITVDPVTECWTWKGADVKGYARVKWNDRAILVHRWVFARFIRPISSHEEIHHLCNNTLCINPKHLEAVDADYHVYITQWQGARVIHKDLTAGDRIMVNGYDCVIVSVFKKTYLLQDTNGEVFELEKN